MRNTETERQTGGGRGRGAGGGREGGREGEGERLKRSVTKRDVKKGSLHLFPNFPQE